MLVCVLNFAVFLSFAASSTLPRWQRSEVLNVLSCLQGYLAHKKQPPPHDHHRALGIVLLQGPRGALFLMSEVPLYVQMSEGAAAGEEAHLAYKKMHPL